MTLTNSVNLVTQSGANITTAAGDTCIIRATAANVVEVLSYKTWAVQKNECTAWVNFNGVGTVAIRDSYNVSSITDNGVGTYDVNFATAMANSNYSAVGMATDTSNGVSVTHSNSVAPTTAKLPIIVRAGGGNLQDCPYVDINISGGK